MKITVRITEKEADLTFPVVLPPHSVSVLVCE